MSAKLYPETMCLNAEERRQFLVQVKASGHTKSGFMRELCGFDPRRRGAPVGNTNRARGKRGAKKPVKPPFDLKPVKPPFDFSPDAEELAGALFRLKSGVRVRSQSNQNSTESALRSGHQIAPPADAARMILGYGATFKRSFSAELIYIAKALLNLVKRSAR